MKVNKWVAILATGSVLAVTAPASAQFGGLGALKKKLESAAKELEKPKTPPAQTTPQSSSSPSQGGYATPTPRRTPAPINPPQQTDAASDAAPTEVAEMNSQEPDQQWECNSGFPDAEFADLRMSKMILKGSEVSGSYTLGGKSPGDDSGSTSFTEQGTVTINNQKYSFAMLSTTASSEFSKTSFFLSKSFLLSKTEEGDPILNEQLSPLRKRMFENEDFDGMEQSCGVPGTFSGR